MRALKSNAQSVIRFDRERVRSPLAREKGDDRLAWNTEISSNPALREGTPIMCTKESECGECVQECNVDLVDDPGALLCSSSLECVRMVVVTIVRTRRPFCLDHSPRSQFATHDHLSLHSNRDPAVIRNCCVPDPIGRALLCKHTALVPVGLGLTNNVRDDCRTPNEWMHGWNDDNFRIMVHNNRNRATIEHIIPMDIVLHGIPQ